MRTPFREWLVWGADVPRVLLPLWAAVMAWSPRRGPQWRWARGIYTRTLTVGMWCRSIGLEPSAANRRLVESVRGIPR